MFFPREMTEVELIVPSKDLVAVAKVISGRGVFHQLDSTYLGMESTGPSVWQEKAGSYSTLERRVQGILQTLSLPEEYPAKAETGSMVELETVRSAVDRIDEDVKKSGDQLTSEKKRLELFESQLRQLEPIAHINYEVGALQKSSYLHSILGVIEEDKVARLETSLSRVPHVFFILKEDPKKPVVWLLGPRSASDNLERAAKSAFLNPLSLPDELLSGTPEQITTTLKKEIEASRQKISELEATLGKLAAKYKHELAQLLWDVHISRVMADAIVRFGQLRHTYVVVGWVPATDLENLTTRLKQASPEILIEAIPTSRTGHHAHVPVALMNNKWLKPIQDLVTTFGRPSYGELDPTLLIAFSFPILYGAMFGDIGQGLILMLVGVLAHNRIFMKGLQSLGLLLVYAGFFATIFGFLYGSIFGFEGHLIEEYLHFHFEPMWMSPLENILTILGLAIDAGIVILFFAFLLGLFNNVRSRDWAHFWFGHTGVVAICYYFCFLTVLDGLLGTTPIAPKIAAAISQLPLPFNILTPVFALGIMFNGFFRNMVEGHRPLVEGGFGMFLVTSFMDWFEGTISMLSNTLSFVRVGAFAVAHGGLSLAIFSLAGEEPDLGFWITIIIGNIFIIGFEGLIVYIQTMRLHYYEILGKFFHGGGMRFEPLVLNPSQEEA